MNVFLGGTTSNSKWREDLIPMLQVSYFNPVVKRWTKEAKQKEDEEKQKADFRLYVITRTYSMYSIAEAVDDSNKMPKKTVFCVLNEVMPNGKMAFTPSNLNRLHAIGTIIEANGGTYLRSLEAVAHFLNATKSN